MAKLKDYLGLALAVVVAGLLLFIVVFLVAAEMSVFVAGALLVWQSHLLPEWFKWLVFCGIVSLFISRIYACCGKQRWR